MSHVSGISRWAMAGLALTVLMPSLDTSIANVALPFLAEAFSASLPDVQWVVLAYLVAMMSFIVGAGRLGDIFGRRRVLLAGIGLFTVASLLCGFAPSLGVLIAARAAQGVGAAIMISLSTAVASEIVPTGGTGSAMGLLGAMSAVGTTLGPSVGGALLAAFGWRAIFVLNVPIGILGVVLVLGSIPALHDAQPASSARTSTLGLLRDVSLRGGLALSLVISMVMMATMVVGPFYLVHVVGLNAARTGLAMSVGPLAAALAGIVAGRLVDHFDANIASMLGLGGMSAGLVALALAPAHFGLPGYLAASVVVTAHYALVQTANNTSIMSGARAGSRGGTAGLLALSRTLGLIAGASAMGAIFTFASSANNIAGTAQSYATGMRVTFLVAGCVTIAALAALAIVNFVSHTERHDSRAGDDGAEVRAAAHRPALALRSRDEAVQPEVARRPGLAAAAGPAPS